MRLVCFRENALDMAKTHCKGCGVHRMQKNTHLCNKNEARTIDSFMTRDYFCFILPQRWSTLLDILGGIICRGMKTYFIQYEWISWRYTINIWVWNLVFVWWNNSTFRSVQKNWGLHLEVLWYPQIYNHCCHQVTQTFSCKYERATILRKILWPTDVIKWMKKGTNWNVSKEMGTCIRLHQTKIYFVNIKFS